MDVDEACVKTLIEELEKLETQIFTVTVLVAEMLKNRTGDKNMLRGNLQDMQAIADTVHYTIEPWKKKVGE